MYVRKFSLLEAETISADLLQSQLEMPTSSTVDEFEDGHVHVSHFNAVTDLVSACVRFTEASEGNSSSSYFNLWSVMVTDNDVINASASLKLEAEDTYDDCYAVWSRATEGRTYAVLRNASDGYHTVIKLSPSARRRMRGQKEPKEETVEEVVVEETGSEAYIVSTQFAT